MMAARALLVEQGNILVIRPLRDRLQVGVDIGEVVVGEDRLRVRWHGTIAGAHEGGECLDRQWIRRKPRAGLPALTLGAVTLPAAVLDERSFALFGGGGECAAAAQDKAGGEYRRPQSTH